MDVLLHQKGGLRPEEGVPDGEMEACLPGIGQEEEAVFAKESPRLMGVRIKDGTMYPYIYLGPGA